MAELADALDSGSSEVTLIQVQVLLSAPQKESFDRKVGAFLFCLDALPCKAAGLSLCRSKKLSCRDRRFFIFVQKRDYLLPQFMVY